MAAAFELKVGEKSYRFVVEEMVTLEALRHVKQWYGAELGRYNNFVSAFFEGDPDAAACAVWMARRAAGETNIPEPQQMESFSLANWITAGRNGDEEANPTEEAPKTPVSTKTRTSSAASTSES